MGRKRPLCTRALCLEGVSRKTGAKISLRTRSGRHLQTVYAACSKATTAFFSYGFSFSAGQRKGYTLAEVLEIEGKLRKEAGIKTYRTPEWEVDGGMKRPKKDNGGDN